MSRTLCRWALAAVCAAAVGWKERAAGGVPAEGIIVEAEDIARPVDAWRRDERVVDRWMLWTREADIEKKRSRGAVMASPSVAKDRASPAEGAPPLHCVVTNLPPGPYRIYVSGPGRPLAYSPDGETWVRYQGGEVMLGPRDLREGRFELWIDDRYAYPPGSPGPGYFDYLRFVPMDRSEFLACGERPLLPPPLQLGDFEAWCTGTGAVSLCWTTSRAVEGQRLAYASGDDKAREVPVEGGPGRNHRVRLAGLDPAREYRVRILADDAGNPVESQSFTFRALPPRPPPTVAQTIPLSVTEPTAVPRGRAPAVIGMPFARGTLAQPDDLRLLNAQGVATPLQAEVFSRWPDGSVKLATLSFLAEAPTGGAAVCRLEARPGAAGMPAAGRATVRVEETVDAWRIRGEGLHFDLGKKVPALFANVAFDRDSDGAISAAERVAAPPRLANLRLETAEGANLTCGAPERLEVEHNGPVRAVLRWSGPLVDEAGVPGWAYVIRATLHAGVPEMRLNVTVINDNPEPKYREVRSLTLRVPLEGAGGVRGALGGRAPVPVEYADGIWVLQHDEHRVRMWDTEAPAARRETGVAVAADSKCRVTVAMRDFWKAYPSGFAVKPDGIHVRLLPPLPDDIYSDANALERLRLFGWCRGGRYIFKAGQPVQKEIVVRYGAADDATDPVAFAGWADAPLLPQAPPEHLCGSGLLSRRIFPRTAGVWDAYERSFDAGFRASLDDCEKQRTWGWMHIGDWFGERLLNYGNNEYDMAWAMALQWARTGDRRCFDRGLEMARHHSTIDTVHGRFSDAWNGLVYEHSFNHVGIGIPRDDPQMRDGVLAKYVAEYGGMLGGAIDRQGHVFQPGNWICAALTGDGWLREVATRVCDNQAARLTPAFDFSIERAGGWPIINMSMAHHFSGDPYYLNAARIMVERALQRQDPASGGWLHRHSGNESGGEQGMGGKAFAVAILSHGLLRYLEQEPRPRPDVERMLVRGADFLRDHAWVPGKGFRYISHLQYHAGKPRRGATEGMNAELVAFAYETTRDPKYLELLNEMLAGHFDKSPSGNGKSFSQAVRQTVFGLDRMAGFGVTHASPSSAPPPNR